MADPVVCNTSPLIALHQIGQVHLLQNLFGRLLVPPAVIQEAQSIGSLPPWIVSREPSQPLGPQMLGVSLGAGESAAIALALEVRASRVILDDRPARRTAQAIGLAVIGTLGVLTAGKRRGWVQAVRPCMDQLINTGFRIAPALYKQVLSDTGESAG